MEKEKAPKAALQAVFGAFVICDALLWVDISPLAKMTIPRKIHCRPTDTAPFQVDIQVDTVDRDWKFLDFSHRKSKPEFSELPNVSKTITKR